jgi:hypothetical protein
MSTEAYIRDPRFELHGAAIKWDRNTSAVWYDERELRYILKQEDWSDIFLVSHHAQWDHGVLSMRYDVHPKMSGCTLAMSRLMFGNHLSVSLDSVRKYFNLPPKTTPYGSFEGKHWHEMAPQVQQALAQGACDEVESKVIIFERLLRDHKFPAAELDVIDSVVKMFSEPCLELDTAILAKLWEEEAAKKINGVEALGITKEQLSSAEAFAELLRAEGIEIETKTSPKGNEIYAFAKNDPFMRDYLLEHDNPRVRALAEARIDAKSTQLQTRAATLGWVASRGPAPVYLFYAGAGTLRPSGGDGCNWLNFKRGAPIRRAVKAPTGFYLAPVDASQIECRVAHYLADPTNPILQKFRNNEDPYSSTASKFYQEEIYNPEYGDPRYDELKAKRGMGKQGQLMCIYGASGKQFKATAAAGTYGPRVDMSIETANAFVDTFRQDTPWICAPRTGYWAQCERVIARLAGGDPMMFGPMFIKDHRIYIEGAPMIYDSMEYHTPQPDDENPKTGWRVKKRDGWRFIWGSKLTQNICEGVSRMIVSQAMIRIKKKYGIRSLNWPYDELLLLIPRNGREEEMLQLCIAEMTVEPSWLPGIPLAAEGALGERYEK